MLTELANKSQETEKFDYMHESIFLKSFLLFCAYTHSNFILKHTSQNLGTQIFSKQERDSNITSQLWNTPIQSNTIHTVIQTS